LSTALSTRSETNSAEVFIASTWSIAGAAHK
jgi:hypothetical protein